MKIATNSGLCSTKPVVTPPHWLVQHWWEPAERLTLQALKAQGVTIDAEGFGYARSRKRKIDCNAVYRLLDEGLWWSILENKPPRHHQRPR